MKVAEGGALLLTLGVLAVVGGAFAINWIFGLILLGVFMLFLSFILLVLT